MSMRRYAVVDTGLLLIENTPEFNYFLKKVKEKWLEEGEKVEGKIDIFDLVDIDDVEVIDQDYCCYFTTVNPSQLEGNIYENSVLLRIDTPSFTDFLSGETMTKEEFINNCKEVWGDYLPNDFNYETSSGEALWTMIG